jgi:hypothetical protein
MVPERIAVGMQLEHGLELQAGIASNHSKLKKQTGDNP